MSTSSSLSGQFFEPQPPAFLLTFADAPIQQDPEKLSGHPTIGAKRVSADVLLNYLASGQTIHDFLNDYDAVTEAEVLAVLGIIKQAILDGELTGARLRDEDSFVMPGVEQPPKFYLGSPRLAHPEQAADFVKEVLEERLFRGE